MTNTDWREQFRKIEVHYHTTLGRPNAFLEPLMIDDEQEKAIISFIDSLLKSKQEEMLNIVYDRMILHTPLKIEQTPGTEFDKGYIFYQDMVVAGFELVEEDLKPIISNILK